MTSLNGASTEAEGIAQVRLAKEQASLGVVLDRSWHAKGPCHEADRTNG